MPFGIDEGLLSEFIECMAPTVSHEFIELHPLLPVTKYAQALRFQLQHAGFGVHMLVQGADQFISRMRQLQCEVLCRFECGEQFPRQDLKFDLLGNLEHLQSLSGNPVSFQLALVGASGQLGRWPLNFLPG